MVTASFRSWYVQKSFQVSEHMLQEAVLFPLNPQKKTNNLKSVLWILFC